MLEFLSSRWLHLTTEQTYPFAIAVDDPRKMRAAAKGTFPGYSADDELPEDVDEEIFRFEGRHDLARALRGFTLPTVFVLREGETVRISTDRGVYVADRRDFFRELEQIGERIAERVRTSKSDRAKAALIAWTARGKATPRQLVLLASAGAHVGTPTLEFWELTNEPGADSELAAAARFMRGAKPAAHDFDVIFAAIRHCPRAECVSLDEATAALKSQLHADRQKDPYEQGYALASTLRGRVSAPDDKWVDIEKIVRVSFGVSILEHILSPEIDAVGCWGTRHGPAMIVNKAGRRASTAAGRRFTIAHELCHLLADRATALPLAEVMGGSSPYLPERRANAFGAEFLLPRWRARAAYKERDSLDKTLTYLTTHFRVGLVLAAAQLRNARNTGISSAEQAKLDQIIKEDPDY